MAKHFAHKVKVEQDDGCARVSFPTGLGTIAHRDGALVLTIEADDSAAAERVRAVLEDHLMRFAHRENPTPLNWMHQ